MKKTRYWFKAKRYGLGWYPATWEGWVLTLFFIILIAINSIKVNSLVVSENKLALKLIPLTSIYTSILIVIAYLKGEKLGWRWGGKKSKK